MADQHNANIPAMGNTIAADIPDIKENLEYHKDVFQAFVNSWSDTVATNIKPKIVGDADNDTLIQCEESSDEDIIRFDIGGTEQVTIQDGKIEPTTDNDIDLGSSSKEFKDLYIDGVAYVDAISIDSVTQGKDITAALHRKIVEIGDWNMDSTAYVNVAHGLTFSKIRTIRTLIRNDADNEYRQLEIYNNAITGYWDLNSTNVVLYRTSGSYFDQTTFDSTSFNRGWVIIDYVD